MTTSILNQDMAPLAGDVSDIKSQVGTSTISKTAHQNLESLLAMIDKLDNLVLAVGTEGDAPTAATVFGKLKRIHDDMVN